MSLRATLAALDDAVLEAAASKGLVRRAHRDHEAGLAGLTSETADAAELTVDGATVRLGAGGLSTATCSCPAQGICRHILAAIIHLRTSQPAAAAKTTDAAAADEPGPDPIAEMRAFASSDLVQAFGRAGLRDAEAILAAASDATDPITVEEQGHACLVRLPGQPEVRYLAALGLAGMISKPPAPLRIAGKSRTPSQKALRAAAVLAVRRLAAGDTMATPAAAALPTPAPPTGTDAGFLDAVTAALAQAARAGLATAPLALEERLLDLALSSRADAMPRLAAQLRGIAEDLSQRRARAATFDPATALAAIARAYALVVALRKAGDDPALRGAVRQPYRDIPRLALTGCGLELWHTSTGARGVTAHAFALAGEAPTWYTLTLARAAGQDPYFVPCEAARSTAVFGHSLARLAGGASFVLDAARVTAGGRLSLGAEMRCTMEGSDLAAAIATQPALVARRWAAIGPRVFPQLSPSLRASRTAVPLLLQLHALAPVQFDAVEQRAWLPVMDDEGHWLALTIATETDDSRLDAIVAIQAEEPPHVLVVTATRDGGTLVLSPIAAMGADGALTQLDLWAPSPSCSSPAPTMPQRLGLGMSALLSQERQGPAFAPTPRSDAASAGLLARASDEALALAELGGRMEDPTRLQTLGRLARELDAAGLAPLAALLARLAQAPSAERPLRLLAFTHAAACHVALAPALPLARRIA